MRCILILMFLILTPQGNIVKTYASVYYSKKCYATCDTKVSKHINIKPKVIKATVTAYCNIPHFSKWKNRNGTAAVDPKHIPYGSYIKFIHNRRTYKLVCLGRHGKNGHVIDVYLSSRSDCRRFGRSKVKVEVIPNGKDKDVSNKSRRKSN